MQYLIFYLSVTFIIYTIRTSHDVLKCLLKQWRSHKFSCSGVLSTVVVGQAVYTQKAIYMMAQCLGEEIRLNTLLLFFPSIVTNISCKAIHKVQRSHSLTFPFFFFLSVASLSLRILHTTISNFKVSASPSFQKAGKFLLITWRI